MPQSRAREACVCVGRVLTWRGGGMAGEDVCRGAEADLGGLGVGIRVFLPLLFAVRPAVDVHRALNQDGLVWQDAGARAAQRGGAQAGPSSGHGCAPAVMPIAVRATPRALSMQQRVRSSRTEGLPAPRSANGAVVAAAGRSHASRSSQSSKRASATPGRGTARGANSTRMWQRWRAWRAAAPTASTSCLSTGALAVTARWSCSRTCGRTRSSSCTTGPRRAWAARSSTTKPWSTTTCSTRCPTRAPLPVLTGHVSSLPPVLTGHVSSLPRTDWTRLVPPPVLTGHVSTPARQGVRPAAAVVARGLGDGQAAAEAGEVGGGKGGACFARRRRWQRREIGWSGSGPCHMTHAAEVGGSEPRCGGRSGSRERRVRREDCGGRIVQIYEHN